MDASSQPSTIIQPAAGLPYPLGDQDIQAFDFPTQRNMKPKEMVIKFRPAYMEITTSFVCDQRKDDDVSFWEDDVHYVKVSVRRNDVSTVELNRAGMRDDDFEWWRVSITGVSGDTYGVNFEVGKKKDALAFYNRVMHYIYGSVL